jgi:ATP-binding cassette subfamily C protein
MVAMLCIGIFAMKWLGYELASISVMALSINRTLDTLNRAQRRYQHVAEHESAYWSLMDTIERAEKAQERVSGGVPATLDRAIEMRSVSFRHADEPVLENLSLEIPAGRITALIGPSGSGKTTIVDLVVGLSRPDAGEVRIDGRSLTEIDLADWRRHVGYVPQEMFLLHDSVAMNVALGDPTVSREKIEQSLKEANAWEFVSRMPEGIDTLVGERGSGLSGGQRQRIAIARALIHDPWLLVLDEATAALDRESERAIWDVVAGFRGRMTVLAISHQQALLDVADRVYRLEDGAVVQVATSESESHSAAVASRRPA